MNARERFDHSLARFVRRKRAFFTGSAAVWAALACLGLALGFVLADVVWEFAPLWRWLGLGTLLGTAAVLLGTLWLGRVCRYRRERAIRELEGARPELGQLLRTGAGLGDEEKAKALGFSPALAEALVQRAGDEVEAIPTERLLPWQTVKRLAFGLLALVLVWLVLALACPDFRTGAARLALPAAPVSYTRIDASVGSLVFERDQTVAVQARISGRAVETAELQIRPAHLPEAEWQSLPMTATAGDTFAAEVSGWTESFAFRIVAGRARTAPQTVRFIDPPRVLECTAELVSPEYTGLAPRTIPLDRLAGVVGSTLRFRFQLNHGLAEGEIRGPGDDIQAVPAGAAEFEFTATLAEGPASFTLTGRDAEGLALKPFVWQARGVPDRPPSIVFETPAEDLRVTRLTEIPIVVRIADDFGLAEVGLVLTINGQERHLAGRKFTGENPRRNRLEYYLRLEDVPVEVNANVRLHAYAADRFPDRQGRSVSDLCMLDIRPFKILYRLPDPDEPPLTSEEQQQLEEQMAKLDDLIKAQQEILAETLREREARRPNPAPNEELARKQEQLAEQLAELREQAQQQEATPEGNEEHLAAAQEHMQKAAETLREPKVPEALKREDEALAEMLRARDQLEQQLRQQPEPQQQQQQQQQQPEPPPPLEDLAARVQELARREQALAEQLQQQQTQPEQQQQAQAEQQQQAEPQAQQQAQAPREELAQRQQEAVAEANQLLEDVRQHPETTALAEQRMAEARERMQEAAQTLAENQPREAEPALREAQRDLERLAEHLRGLDQQRALETMQTAREKAEQAAEQLEQPAPNQAEQREELAREAETLADWTERMAETRTPERERMARRLEEARKQLATEQLPEDIREAERDREQGREEQAQQQDRQTAERLNELAKTFERERRELVATQLERLAKAEVQTQRMAQEVEREAANPTPPKPNQPNTAEKLGELARDYRDLKDQRLAELARQLEVQVGPQNIAGPGKNGPEIPEEVTRETLEPAAKRLRQLIDEMVEREMLLGRDSRVPERYAPLVETYFKELSDDARE